MIKKSNGNLTINWLVLLLVLITLIWFGLSTYWYSCQIRESCNINSENLSELRQQKSNKITSAPSENNYTATDNTQSNSNSSINENKSALENTQQTNYNSQNNIASSSNILVDTNNNNEQNNFKAEIIPLNNQHIATIRTVRPRATSNRMKLILNYELSAIEPTFDEETLIAFNQFIAKLAKSQGKILIIGHADSATGDQNINDTLSMQRANKLKELLIIAGIDESRIIARGRGGNDPIAPNDLEIGRKLNRRAVISLIPANF